MVSSSLDFCTNISSLVTSHPLQAPFLLLRYAKLLLVSGPWHCLFFPLHTNHYLLTFPWPAPSEFSPNVTCSVKPSPSSHVPPSSSHASLSVSPCSVLFPSCSLSGCSLTPFTISGERVVQQEVLETPIIHMEQEIKIRSLPRTTHRINSRSIDHLHVKCKTLKLFEEKMRKMS